MTNQELFDRVAGHLLRQNEQSLDEEGACCYRGAEGLMCAIGCLIPDDTYSYNLEHKACDHSAVIKAAGLVGSYQIELAKQLQDLHDECPPASWPKRLATLAKDHGLVFP